MAPPLAAWHRQPSPRYSGARLRLRRLPGPRARLGYALAGRADLTPLVTSPTGTSGEAVDLDNLGETAAISDSDEIAAARAAQAAAELERQKARIIRKWVIQNNKDWDASEAPAGNG